MNDYTTIRMSVIAYMWHAVSSARVTRRPSDATCSSMIDRLVDIFFAANDGLVERIVDEVNRASTRKVRNLRKSWAAKLRAAVHTFADSLYHEMDIAGLFVSNPQKDLPCRVVLDNSDCMLRAARSARVLAKKRSSLYGYIFFWKDVA